jgi:hypothetical protein
MRRMFGPKNMRHQRPSIAGPSAAGPSVAAPSEAGYTAIIIQKNYTVPLLHAQRKCCKNVDLVRI